MPLFWIIIPSSAKFSSQAAIPERVAFDACGSADEDRLTIAGSLDCCCKQAGDGNNDSGELHLVKGLEIWVYKRQSASSSWATNCYAEVSQSIYNGCFAKIEFEINDLLKEGIRITIWMRHRKG